MFSLLFFTREPLDYSTEIFTAFFINTQQTHYRYAFVKISVKYQVLLSPLFFFVPLVCPHKQL